MSDYFEERKRESEKKDDYWEKKKQETAEYEKRKKEFWDKPDTPENRKIIARLRRKYSWGKVKKMPMPKETKPVKKPKRVLTVAEKKARTAKRKRTAKKIVGFIKRAIYGKPKRKTTKRKTTVKKKK